jgi:hypothetical protein
MVAVVTELMVGGECSTEGDWTKGSVRALVSKPLAQSVASQQRRDLFALDNIFALIEDTFAQTFFLHQLFPCSQTADHTFVTVSFPPLHPPRRKDILQRTSMDRAEITVRTMLTAVEAPLYVSAS